MSDKYFLDTNIFVYSFDDLEPEKKEISLALIANALQTGNGLISWQVVQEFLNVSTRKFKTPLVNKDAKIYLEQILAPLCKVYPDVKIYRSALEISQQTGYSFYDSLILAGAGQAGCQVLYSEDLQNGQQVDGFKIINPYRYQSPK